MTHGRDPRYDILFTPVALGPVVARNRFFQVPHCNGMGYRDPSAEAFMRGVKAEGGWAVVCTEEVEIRPTADITPSIELRLWDDADIPSVARIAEKIHEHGALAGIELVHGGLHSSNLTSRIAPLGPSGGPVTGSYNPVQGRAMTRSDIAAFRQWHRAAVGRSLQAGYDVIYVYAGHGYTNLQHFLSPIYNQRADEYGGSVGNRMRLLREVLEDTDFPTVKRWRGEGGRVLGHFQVYFPEEIAHAAGAVTPTEEKIADLVRVIQEAGKVAVQRAYADWRRYPQYIVPLSEASIDLIFAPAYGSSKKNATDIRLAIDAMELVFTRPEIGTIILLSGEITLLLDEADVPMKPFDVVVQRGTNHAWVNTGDEVATLVAVLGALVDPSTAAPVS